MIIFEVGYVCVEGFVVLISGGIVVVVDFFL